MVCAETKVVIRDMHVECRIGEFHEERHAEQAVIFNLEILLHDAEMLTDDIAATVNYRTVAERVRQVAGESSCVSLERLAELVGQACLENPRVRWVKVEAEKPRKIPGCGPVGVIRTFRRIGSGQPTLAYLTLSCSDIDETRSFYELLGFRFRKEQHGKRGVAHYATEDQYSILIELYPRQKGETHCAQPRRFGIAVPDLPAALKALKARYRRTGVSETSKLFVDPDGRTVAIVQA